MRRRRTGHGNDLRAAQLTEELSSDQLERAIEEDHRLLLAYFWSPACEPCRTLRPQLEQLAPGAEGVCRIVAVNVDTNPAAGARHSVSSTPTIVFFKNGVPVHRFRGGALPASVLELLR